jgi:glycerophosphoryl diester phosphodiesterase
LVAIYAHRGASLEFPENTLPAFARALELGAYGIELDVHLSADGVPVVIHDDTLDRTTNGTGAVASQSVDYLKGLDAGAGSPVPTLSDVLDLVAGKLHVDIEIKAGEAGDAVLRVVGRYPQLAFAISSFNHDALRHVREKDARVELWPLTVAISDDVLKAAQSLGAPQIAAFDGMLNAEIMKTVAEAGLQTWVWTVNDPRRAKELVTFGAVGICTDDPASMLSLQAT